MKKFFKEAGLVGVSEVVLRLKSLIILPILTQQLGPKDFGSWSQVFSILSLIIPLLMLGIENGMIRYAAGSTRRQQARYFSAVLIFIFLSSSLTTFLMIIFKEELAAVFFEAGEKYILLIILTAFDILVLAILQIFKNWFLLTKSIRRYSWLAILQGLLGALTAVLIYYLDQGVIELVIYKVITDLMIVIGLVWIYFKEEGLAGPDFRILKPAVGYGLSILPLNFSIWGLNLADRLFLVNYHNLREVGIYSLAYTIASTIVTMLSAPFWASYPTRVSELYNQKKHKNIQELFDHAVGAVITLTIPAIFGLSIIGPDLLELLSSAEYAQSTMTMIWISLGYLAFMLASYFQILLGLKKRLVPMASSYIIAFASNLLFNYLLIPSYGAEGAALATFISFLILLASNYLLYLFLAKVVAVKFVFIIKIIAVSSVMFVICYLAESMMGVYNVPPYGKIIITSLLGAGTYFSLLLLSGVVHKKYILGFRKQARLSVYRTNPQDLGNT